MQTKQDNRNRPILNATLVLAGESLGAATSYTLLADNSEDSDLTIQLNEHSNEAAYDFILDAGDVTERIFLAESSMGTDVLDVMASIDIPTYDSPGHRVRERAFKIHSPDNATLFLFECIPINPDHRTFTLKLTFWLNRFSTTSLAHHTVPDLTIQRIVSSHISGEDLADVRFALYSSRISGIKQRKPGSQLSVGRLRSAYGNSALLKSSSEYLSTLLSGGGFAESQEKNFHQAFPTSYEDYEYYSDSDLSDTEEADLVSAVGDHNSSQVTRQEVLQDVRSDLHPVSRSPGKLGKVILLKGFAYKTWSAYLLYLYTGKIQFAPLMSNSQTRTQDRPSPKSMYRLADIVDDAGLRELAINHISSQLNKDNITDEVFSKFTSWYPQVREVQLQFMMQHFKEIQDMPNWDAKIQQITRGELPHASSVLIDIMKAGLRTSV